MSSSLCTVAQCTGADPGFIMRGMATVVGAGMIRLQSTLV